MCFSGTSPCADVIASFWGMQAKTHVSLNNHILYFLPIMESFLTYLVILTHDKHYWSFGYHWHIHFMSVIKVKTHLVSPPCICLLSTFNELYPFFFYRHYTMAEYAFFMEKADWWRKDMAPLWGNLNICPQLHWLQLPCHSQVELSSLNGLEVWGRDKSPPWHCFPVDLGRGCHRGKTLWPLHCMGRP